MIRPILIFILASLAACSPEPTQNISANYNKKAADIGIFPVFPPREEFQVGDIYLYSIDLNQKEFVTEWVGFDRNLVQAAQDFLGTRIVFNQTSSDSTDPPSDLTNGTIRTRAPHFPKVNNLPLAAFPEITGDSGLTTGLGISRLFQAIGLGAGSTTSVTLNFDDVRTFWAPPARVPDTTKTMLSDLRNNVLNPSPGSRMETAIRSLAIKAVGRSPKKFDVCDPKNQIGLIAISRVYLTRKIDYTYRNAQIISAGIRRASGGTALEEAPTAPEVNLEINLSGDDANATDTLKLVQNVLQSVNSNAGSVGEALSFESWNALGITFSQSYSRPVSIGWEGVPLVFETDKSPDGRDVDKKKESVRQIFCDVFKEKTDFLPQ